MLSSVVEMTSGIFCCFDFNFKKGFVSVRLACVLQPHTQKKQVLTNPVVMLVPGQRYKMEAMLALVAETVAEVFGRNNAQ